MAQANRIDGTVVDAVSGAPITRFKVFYLAEGEGDIEDYAGINPSRGLVRHHAKGEFHLIGLAPGTYQVLIDPSACGYERTVLRDVSIPRSDPLVIRAGRGAHVEGRVIDRLGRPVSNVQVLLIPKGSLEEWPPSPERKQETDQAGRFLFTMVPPARYALSTGNTERIDTEAFTVLQDQRVEMDVLLPPTHSLTVAVSDRGGIPLESVRIDLWSRGGVHRSGTTDSKGEIRIHGLPTEVYTVRADYQGFKARSMTVEMDTTVGERGLRITLDRFPSL